jgi:23S rRNA (guanosine2251-2'-O)-methyltransferase
MSKQQLHWISGIHAVRAALKHGAGHIVELWVDNKRADKRLKALLQEAKQQAMQIHAVDRKSLESKVGKVNHQGIAACTPLPATGNENSLDELLSRLNEPPFLLVLDGVTDPHNLGACLRTADATGVHAVIAPRDKSVGLTPVVCKVASGAAETVPFIQVTNLARTLRHLREHHRIFLVGLAGESGQDLYAGDLRARLGLVMGAEGAGLRRLTRECCDQLLALPMQGSVESLNVSVATGVCLYEALRQRS